MKLIAKLLIITSIFCNTLLPISQPLTPKNTIVIFDLDDTLIKKSPFHKPNLVIGGVYQKPLNSKNYMLSLLRLSKSYSKNELGIKGVYDNHGNKINHLTFQFLYNGMRDPKLTPYVAWMSETVEYSRWTISGTLKICRYLKEQKGYTIDFATNKDPLSYELTARAFGNTLTNLPNNVFISQPANDHPMLTEIKQFADLPTTDASYKLLAEQALTINPTKNIIHIPYSKPDINYFTLMEELIGKDKNMVFVDDKKSNIKTFNTLKENNTALRHGILIPKKNKAQHLAAELVKCGILSETEDKQLLDEINHPWKTFLFNKLRINKN